MESIKHYETVRRVSGVMSYITMVLCDNFSRMYIDLILTYTSISFTTANPNTTWLSATSYDPVSSHSLLSPGLEGTGATQESSKDLYWF